MQSMLALLEKIQLSYRTFHCCSRRLVALTDATLHAVREVRPAALGPHVVDVFVTRQIMESAAATATVGSVSAGGTLGWQHVLRELHSLGARTAATAAAAPVASQPDSSRIHALGTASAAGRIFCSKKV